MAYQECFMIKYDILIAAYNAQNTLPKLLRRIAGLSVPPNVIYIIDDGSHDLTTEEAKAGGARVTTFEKNRGKGYALRRGFTNFRQTNHSDYLLCMDADLQHPVSAVDQFLIKARSSDSKIIIGNRDKKPGSMPLPRIISNRLSSFLISRLTKQTIPDSQCGFRLIHRSVLEIIQLNENGFQMESEFILRSARAGFKIDFVNIPTVYNGHHSYIRHWNDTFRFIRLIIRELVK